MSWHRTARMWAGRLVPAIALAAGIGCARTRSTPTAADCFLSAPPSGPPEAGEIIVQLADAVEPIHAPMPGNDAEAILFRNLYETLTEIDCDGELRGRLADRWDSDAEKRTWTITLEPRRFWDGSAMRSEDVLFSWRTSALRAATARAPWCWIDPSRVIAIDSRRIQISLDDPMPDLPRLLAHSALGVASTRPGEAWPVGTGTFRVAQSRGDLVQCEPNEYASPVVSADRSARIAFQPRPGSDPRDLDMAAPFVRRVWNRKAVSFLATRGMQVQRLPWSRRYVVLLADPLSLSLDRVDIAAVVAESEAEPCTDLGWSGLPCGPLALPWSALPERGGEVPLPPEAVVMALADDPDATRIAERIASRASAALGKPIATRPVGPLPFEAALSAGRALVFVIAIPLELEATCAAPSDLVIRAPWLLDGWDPGRLHAGVAEPGELERFLIESGAVVPVLRVGASIVSRPGLAGIRIDGAALPHFQRAGWIRGAALP
jgi:hypothetical protein